MSTLPPLDPRRAFTWPRSDVRAAGLHGMAAMCDLLPMRGWLPALLVAYTGLAGCSAEIPERRFRCAVSGECPSGWYCVDGHCQSTPGLDASFDAPPAADGGHDAGAIDAGSADATAQDGGLRPCTSPGDCNDMNPCTFDMCGADRRCAYWDADGSACDDGVFCNGEDMCSSGECTHAGSPCTGLDTCDEAADICACDDGNRCTAGDARQGDGTCRGTNADGTLCGLCDAGGCRICCGGSCVNGNQFDRCAGCGSCSSSCGPCGGTESCVYAPEMACGWRWCCSCPC